MKSNSYTVKMKFLENEFLNTLLSIIILLIAQVNYCYGQNKYNPAISSRSKHIVGWANLCEVQRGYVQISDKSISDNNSIYSSYGKSENGINMADGNCVSLGDGGYAILKFSLPINDKAGCDFAIFENAMSSSNKSFIELAFVEVSNNGNRYFRFPSVSLMQNAIQCSTFEPMDSTMFYNFAGVNTTGLGTCFDLSELKDSIELDINNIKFIRIIDAIGSIDPQFATKDSKGNIVNDPYPTPFYSCGFDLDAVALIDNFNDIEQKANIELKMRTVNELINVSCLQSIDLIQVYDLFGRQVYTQKYNNQREISIDKNQFKPEQIHIFKITTKKQIYIQKMYW